MMQMIIDYNNEQSKFQLLFSHYKQSVSSRWCYQAPFDAVRVNYILVPSAVRKNEGNNNKLWYSVI